MGGSGSGYRTSKASTVEDCLTLDVGKLIREARENAWSYGSTSWSVGGREPHARLAWSLEDWGEKYPYRLVLRYTRTPRGGEPDTVEEPVRLELFPLPTGGQKTYALCPHCGLRVVKLHLPPGGRLFACRSCYRLTYESCQRSDKRRSAFLRDPVALMAALRDPKKLKEWELLALLRADL